MQKYTNTSLIASHLTVVEGSESGICKVCGQSTEHGFKAKMYIKDSRFTNYDLLKDVSSGVICANCAACLSEAKLRRSSFIADSEKIMYLQKNDIENYVFALADTVKVPFVFCITESFKKHISFKAALNYSTKRFVITHENYSFTFDSVKMKDVYKILNEFYLYFSKDELISGDYNALSMKSYFVVNTNEDFMQSESVLRANRGSQAFNFLVYILNAERRNEILKERKKCKKK